MLIGKRWVEKTRLKILNTSVGLPGGWSTCPGFLATNLTERGFLAGFTAVGVHQPGARMEYQILFDGRVIHQGEIRTFHDIPIQRAANQQPMSMSIPAIDVPENTQITIRIQQATAVQTELHYVDLYVVVYYIKDWDAAIPAVCFPTDVARPDSV